jgi:hypothetical protein
MRFRRGAEFGIGRMPIELWTRRLQMEPAKPSFCCDVFIKRTCSSDVEHVEMVDESIVVNDYIETRCRLYVGGSRAAVLGDSLDLVHQRAPELLARHYRATFGDRCAREYSEHSRTERRDIARRLRRVS